MNLLDFITEHKFQFILALAGIFLLSVGIVSVIVISLKQAEPKVEVISTDEDDESKKTEIIVDVEGAVEKPGVYHLNPGSRVNDALTAAGGFSIEADRIWISKYINLAQPLNDGVKVYIPLKNHEVVVNANPVAGDSLNPGQGQVIGTDTQMRVNINIASVAELDGLWGIGEARANQIIKNRPYGKAEELTEKKIIPANVFERIKDQITVY